MHTQRRSGLPEVALVLGHDVGDEVLLEFTLGIFEADAAIHHFADELGQPFTHGHPPDPGR